MFSSSEREKYAQVLVWAMGVSRSTGYGPGDVVVLRYDLPAAALAEDVYALLVERGLMCVCRANPTARMDQALYGQGSPGQLLFLPPGEKSLCRSLNGSILLLAPESLHHLKDVDPGGIAQTAKARKPLRDILEAREQAGEFGWTLCAHPTAALAEAAGLDLADYTRQVAAACYLNLADPVHEWKMALKNVRDVQARLNELDLVGLHLQSETCDLIVPMGENRRWLGLTGHNIPSFELYVSPDWRGVAGRYAADLPSYRGGNRVSGVVLDFEKGRVVRARAEEGEQFLLEQLAMDRGACSLGEFSLTDKRLSRIDAFMAMTLFDENHGGRYGNCHVALGASYPGTFAGPQKDFTPEVRRKLGFNVSALHWDLVNVGPKLVTGRLASGKSVRLYEDGEFVI